MSPNAPPPAAPGVTLLHSDGAGVPTQTPGAVGSAVLVPDSLPLVGDAFRVPRCASLSRLLSVL